MDGFNLTYILLGGMVTATVGTIVAAFAGLFKRMRDVETENAEANIYREAVNKRLESLEGEVKSLRGCLIPMKSDIAAIKAMMEAAFGKNNDKG